MGPKLGQRNSGIVRCCRDAVVFLSAFGPGAEFIFRQPVLVRPCRFRSPARQFHQGAENVRAVGGACSGRLSRLWRRAARYGRHGFRLRGGAGLCHYQLPCGRSAARSFQRRYLYRTAQGFRRRLSAGATGQAVGRGRSGLAVSARPQGAAAQALPDPIQERARRLYGLSGRNGSPVESFRHSLARTGRCLCDARFDRALCLDQSGWQPRRHPVSYGADQSRQFRRPAAQ